jgi:hypothetical protein
VTLWEKLHDIGFELIMVAAMIGVIVYTIRGKSD